MQNKVEMSDSDKLKVQLLKSVYAGKPDMLKTTRKVVLGLDALDEEEQKKIDSIKANKDLMDYLLSVLNPTVNGNEEVFMVNDIWFQINLKDKSASDAIIFMKAVEGQRNFMNDVLKSNVNRTVLEFDFSPLKSDTDNLINIITRSLILSSVETTLRGIKVLAGEEGETLEQLAKRLEQNSTK
jgi:hypothetical protein